MQKRTIAHFAVLAVNMIYAGGFSLTKIIMPSLILPRGFILLRVLVATALFWLFYVLRKKKKQAVKYKKIRKKDFGRIMLCAFFGVAMNQLFFFEGLALTTPVHAALMMLTTPILVVLLASLVLRERFTLNRGLGISFGLVGAYLLISMSQRSDLGTNPKLGDLYVFINAASYAIYLIAVKPLMEKYSALAVIRWVFLFAAIIVFPFGIQQLAIIDWQVFTINNFLVLAYVLLGMTFLAYLWNIYAMKELSPTVIGAYIYMQPFLAAIIAVFFFKEEMTWVKVIAGTLIFAGVWMVSKRKSIE